MVQKLTFDGRLCSIPLVNFNESIFKPPLPCSVSQSQLSFSAVARVTELAVLRDLQRRRVARRQAVPL